MFLTEEQPKPEANPKAFEDLTDALLPEQIDNWLKSIMEDITTLQGPFSVIFKGERVLGVIDEVFTAGLVGLRLHPLLNSGQLESADTLKEMLVNYLLSTQGVECLKQNGGWRFFHNVQDNDPIIDPDTDTTAICLSSLILLGGLDVSSQQVSMGYDAITDVICSQAMRTYFDDSWRVDIIVVVNMLFFVILVNECSEERIQVSTELRKGMEKSVELICYCIECSESERLNWFRYYHKGNSSTLNRLMGFVIALLERWPSLPLLDPLRKACTQMFSTITIKETDTFLDHAVYRACQSVLFPEREVIRAPILDLFPKKYDSLYGTGQKSFVFSSRIYPAAMGCKANFIKSGYVGECPRLWYEEGSQTNIRATATAATGLLSTLSLTIESSTLVAKARVVPSGWSQKTELDIATKIEATKQLERVLGFAYNDSSDMALEAVREYCGEDIMLLNRLERVGRMYAMYAHTVDIIKSERGRTIMRLVLTKMVYLNTMAVYHKDKAQEKITRDTFQQSIDVLRDPNCLPVHTKKFPVVLSWLIGHLMQSQGDIDIFSSGQSSLERYIETWEMCINEGLLPDLEESNDQSVCTEEDIQRYIDMRRNTICVLWFYKLNECVLPGQEPMNIPQDIQVAITDFTWLNNDIRSLERDIVANKVNIVLLLGKLGLSHMEIVDRLKELLNNAYEQILFYLRAQMRNKSGQGVMRKVRYAITQIKLNDITFDSLKHYYSSVPMDLNTYIDEIQSVFMKDLEVFIKWCNWQPPLLPYGHVTKKDKVPNVQRKIIRFIVAETIRNKGVSSRVISTERVNGSKVTYYTGNEYSKTLFESVVLLHPLFKSKNEQAYSNLRVQLDDILEEQDKSKSVDVCKMLMSGRKVEEKLGELPIYTFAPDAMKLANNLFTFLVHLEGWSSEAVMSLLEKSPSSRQCLINARSSLTFLEQCVELESMDQLKFWLPSHVSIWQLYSRLALICSRWPDSSFLMTLRSKLVEAIVRTRKTEKCQLKKSVLLSRKIFACRFAGLNVEKEMEQLFGLANPTGVIWTGWNLELYTKDMGSRNLSTIVAFAGLFLHPEDYNCQHTLPDVALESETHEKPHVNYVAFKSQLRPFRGSIN